MDQILENAKQIFEDVKTFFVNLVDDIGLTTSIIAGSAILALFIFIIILLVVNTRTKKDKKVTSTKTAWENSKDKVIESTRVMESPLSNTASFIVSGKSIKEEKVNEEFDNAKFLREVEEIRSVKPVKILEKDLPMSDEFDEKAVAKKPVAKKAATTKKPVAKTATAKKVSKAKEKVEEFSAYSETIRVNQDEIIKKTAKFKKDIDQKTSKQLAEVDKILGKSLKEVKESEKSIKEFGQDLDNFMKEMDKIKKAGK